MKRKGIDMDNRMRNQFARALLARPAPCDNCPNNAKCALDLKACRTFQHYVVTGSINAGLSRMPTRAMFNDVFYADEEFTEKVLRIQLRKETEL
jgi:hypothetical protein